MAITKKVKYCAADKCLNTLCYDRLPNGICDMEENPKTCVLSRAFNKLGEAIVHPLHNVGETWVLIKNNKLKDALNEKISIV